MRHFHLTIFSAVVVLASCGPGGSTDEVDEAAAPDTTAQDPAMAETAECTNPEAGYSIRYPAAWHVNTDEPLGPCALFDPEPIVVPRASEIPIEIAVMIDVEPVPFATLTGNVRGRRDLSRLPVTVDGRQAMRIEGEATGEGLYDRGIRSYQYFVELGDSTLIAGTYDAGSFSFERKRRILDAMLESTTFQ